MPTALLTPLRAPREDYVVFLGRFSPEKGPLLAIAAARAAGVRLLLAAKIDPLERPYFEAEVRPRLAHGWAEYVGEVDDEEKRQLLGRARALLAPIDWPEPFGLVFIEALATGTPVITRPCGAAPEVVVHGRTGWIARTVPELAAAIRAADRIDPRACRAAFEQRFSVERMAREYEALYRGLIARRRRAARVEVRA
jgi:glycosyltransferase involved in cell wall biosynthesis